MLTKETIIKTLKDINLNNNDTIMIHSSLRAIGPIEGNACGLINTLKEYLKDGLILFPTHTWAYMKEDNMVFDKNTMPSCVGALTNVALSSSFVRSNHPTHSICAWGNDAFEYIKYDDLATTPVGPNNCFGKLLERKAKILFLGASLSKNTYIHSIEEEFNVPDRFTSFIYHFISKDNDNIKEYNMPRHYSTKSAHISDHYEKLLPRLLDKGIAKYFKFGNADSYIVDVVLLHEYVSELLNKNLHIFDDFTPIK